MKKKTFKKVYKVIAQKKRPNFLRGFGISEYTGYDRYGGMFKPMPLAVFSTRRLAKEFISMDENLPFDFHVKDCRIEECHVDDCQEWRIDQWV